MKLKWLGHSSFKLSNGNVIYFDPYQINEEEKADIIFISHGHHDHYSPEDVKKIYKDETNIITTDNIPDKSDVTTMKAGDKLHLKGVDIEAVPSYNVNKFRAKDEPYHPKGFGLGFVVELNKKKLYFAGDSDFIPEMKGIKADIALVPVGGIYTMNVEEAVEAVKVIRPKIAIPMHYGSIVGSRADADDFKIKAEKAGVKVVVLDKDGELEI